MTAPTLTAAPSRWTVTSGTRSLRHPPPGDRLFRGTDARRAHRWLYYTLASASLLLADLPVATAKKLPRYPSVPAVRMGRLAVDLGFRGQGLGSALLADALDRAARAEIAAYALVVEAKDDPAATFYKHHGFIALPDAPMTLFLPLATVNKAR